MPEIPNELKPRLQTWWGALDDGTHTIFEAIYMEAPAAVSRAISGGAWVADSAEPGLSAQLGGDATTDSYQAYQNVPAVVPASEIRVSPNTPVETPVRIVWSEQNPSAVDSPAYFTDVYVEDEQGTAVGSARLENPPLKAGETVDRTFEFAGSATAGYFIVKIYTNSEGSEPGVGVPGAQGFRGYSSGQFAIGHGDDAADQQNSAAVEQVIMSILQTVSETVPTRAVEQIREGVGWLANAHDRLDGDDRETLGNIRRWLDSPAVEDPEQNGATNQTFQDALAALIGAAQQANTQIGEEERRKAVLRALKTFTSRSYLL